jgi:hypothetical protein
VSSAVDVARRVRSRDNEETAQDQVWTGQVVRVQAVWLEMLGT